MRTQLSVDRVDVHEPRLEEPAAAGIYVPTVIPLGVQWAQRKTWLRTSPAQFRPGPPPELTSALWARDYDEVKTLGGKISTRRTPDQTEAARFWEADLGAALFVLMDSLLAWNRFRNPFPGAQALIHATYFPAQWLIAISTYLTWPVA